MLPITKPPLQPDSSSLAFSGVSDRTVLVRHLLGVINPQHHVYCPVAKQGLEEVVKRVRNKLFLGYLSYQAGVLYEGNPNGDRPPF